MTLEHLAYVHSGLPRSLPPKLVVADVELDPVPRVDDIRPLLWRGLPGRVRRMVRGTYAGERIILRPIQISSCDGPLGNGTAGLVVGLPRGVENGVLVLDPIGAWSHEGFRLADGYVVPKDRLQLHLDYAASAAKVRLAGSVSARGPPDAASLAAVTLVLLPLVLAAAATAATLLIRRRGERRR